jgi:alpha-beta hydrolase superfamily lysophospholipase
LPSRETYGVSTDTPCNDHWKSEDYKKFSIPECSDWEIGNYLKGYVWKAKNPKAIVLLQHGYSEYSFRYVNQYNEFIPNLVKNGITVYAFDLWGHGYSPGLRAEIDLFESVQDHIRAREKISKENLPIYLIGHSLGGLVTISSLTENHQNVKGVILLSPALNFPSNTFLNRGILSFLNTLNPGWKILPRNSKEELYQGSSNDPILQNDPLIYKDKSRIIFAHSTLKLIQKNEGLYHSIQTPILIFHGDKDQITPLMGSQRLIETISSRDKSLKVIPEGHHELLNDTQKDFVLQSSIKWIQDHLSPKK